MARFPTPPLFDAR